MEVVKFGLKSSSLNIILSIFLISSYVSYKPLKVRFVPVPISVPQPPIVAA